WVASRMMRHRSRYCAPSSVRCKRRVVRFMSDTPSSRSSAASVRTTVGSEHSSASAAAVILPVSMIRTKVCIAANLSMRRYYCGICNSLLQARIFITSCRSATLRLMRRAIVLGRAAPGICKESGMTSLRWVLAGVALVALPEWACADVITDWNEKAVAFVSKQKMLPPQAERVLASLHVAMFDAVNSIEPRYRPYRLVVGAGKHASKEAAAATAAGTVLAG